MSQAEVDEVRQILYEAALTGLTSEEALDPINRQQSYLRMGRVVAKVRELTARSIGEMRQCLESSEAIDRKNLDGTLARFAAALEFIFAGYVDLSRSAADEAARLIPAKRN